MVMRRRRRKLLPPRLPQKRLLKRRNLLKRMLKRLSLSPRLGPRLRARLRARLRPRLPLKKRSKWPRPRRKTARMEKKPPPLSLTLKRRPLPLNPPKPEKRPKKPLPRNTKPRRLKPRKLPLKNCPSPKFKMLVLTTVNVRRDSKELNHSVTKSHQELRLLSLRKKRRQKTPRETPRKKRATKTTTSLQTLGPRRAMASTVCELKA